MYIYYSPSTTYMPSHHPRTEPSLKHTIISNIHVDKLIYGGSGLATAPDGRKIIISGGAIPQSIVDIRITKVKKWYMEGQVQNVVKKSPLEQDIPAPWQLYGGCKWLTLAYSDQLRIKSEQVHEAFHPLREYVSDAVFHPITPSPQTEWYRNKVEFSWGKYISEREWVHDEFRFGFHAPAQFDRIIDCTYCVLADAEINSIYQAVDTFSRASGIPTYDPKTTVGFWRHLVVRKAKKTDEIMLIFSVNTWYDSVHTADHIQQITDFVHTLAATYPHIVSVYILHNTWRADIVTGEEVLIHGKTTISEVLLDKKFDIQPKSFFQTNSLGAEKLYTIVVDAIKNKGWILLDMYAGTGTIGILLSPYFATVHSVELVPSASADGARNAIANDVHNIEFVCTRAEDFAKKYVENGHTADTVVIDPPRDGMHPSTLPCILSLGAREIVYVSCNPSTLVRDLHTLLRVPPRTESVQGADSSIQIVDTEDIHTDSPPENEEEEVKNPEDIHTQSGYTYRVTDIYPMDMFPHTHHIETVVRLERVD